MSRYLVAGRTLDVTARLPSSVEPPVTVTTAPTAPHPERVLGRVEFTSLLAMSMALSALGIDLMLPAFGAIREGLGLAPDSTAVSGLVTTYFLGLAAGQLFYGPIADRFGRRPTLYLGYGIYAVGALLATFAPTLELILASRVVWGLGAAGSRVVVMAVIRDAYEGERMSRAMSFVMAVFILVPVLAPSLGAAIAAVASWRWIFGACVAAVAVMALWSVRLPETLREEHRRALRYDRIAEAAKLVASNRRTVAYSLAMTSLYGVLAAYLGSAEIIFTEVFDAGDRFPVLFGGLAGVMGVGMLANARVVGRLGVRRLAHLMLVVYLGMAAVLLLVTLLTGGRPPLWAFMVGMGGMLACHALVIPNFNTIAMQPMAAVAGTASSVIGAVQIAGGAVLGSILDRSFDGTVTPLSLGFVALGLVALALVAFAERGQLFERLAVVEARTAAEAEARAEALEIP